MAEASDLGSDVVQHKEEQAEQHEHEHEHHAGHCEHHHHGAPFDLTILVPKARFTASLSGGNAGKAASSGSSSSDNLDDYVPLFLPATDVDVLRDIKQSVADSAEGFWIGSHSYQRVTLREEAPSQEGDEPKLFLEGQASETFPDSTDLATVFAGEEYKSGELRRALKAVDTPYTDSEARAHVLRVRDASLSYTAALHAKRVYQPPPYDPSQMLIDGGLSLFTAIRGPEEIEGNPVAEQSEDAQVNGAPSSKSSKKAKGKAAKPAKASRPAAPAPSAKKESTPFVPSASFLDADQDAQAIYLARKDLLPKSSLPPPSFRNLQLSVWNPPPQHLRLRGHYLYLNVATLEGENYHISATRDGFYVNKSDNHHFDPSPKSQPSKAHPQGHITHHTLFALLAALSSQFAERTQALISQVIPMSPDFFASIAITNCLPAAPWLVPSPDPVADGARSQTAYLLTGATNAEFLPNTKDWNEELTSMRELPRESNDERLMRDRYACRLHADFQLAAARGVMSIARGDVPPLNAIDASEANSYLAYNILFTPAQDSVDTYKHLGGDEAARVTASKDIWATKLLSDADIPGLHTIATAIIDYCGERWIAQAIPPGIFNKTSDENKETAKKEEQADGEATEKDEGKKEKTTDEEAADPEESAKKVPQSVGLRAVYGPANTDKPYEQYVAEASFEPLAQKIAEHFHLAKHTVTDSKGRELEMWTPADVHGLIGSDGRSYAIDLFRLTPVDVKFLEEDSTKIFGQDGKSGKEEDAYPHRVTLLRPELVEVYHSIKTREWIEAQVQAQTEKDKAAETPAVPAIEDGDNSVEKPESATSEDFVKVDKEGDTSTQKKGEDADKPKEKKQTVINVADFKLAFNPDAFVDRPDLPAGHWTSKTDEEDENTKAVRQASEYLRATVIPSLMWEIISEETLPLDSSELSQMLHKRGINIRYLGHIAELCKTAPPTKSSVTRTPEAEQEVVNFLAKFRSFLIGDMIMRGAKHVLRKLIKDITAVELTEVVAHFLNCFLGAALSAEPKPVNTTNSSNTWTTLTPAALREQVSREVLRRYRFVLPESAFEEDLSKLRTLRELCLATGIQLELRNYTFKKAQANGHAEEASTQEQKKQGGAKKARSASPTPAERETTFVPEDILNVHPVVKNAPFKSSLADDILERGQMYFIRGNVEMGEAFVSDGLNMYDQIYGAVHPEMAEAYRQIGGLYHRMAAPLLRRIQLYEQTRSLARDEDRERIKKETGISTDGELEGAKYQHEIYLQQAVKLMRQAVVISERVHGIDSSETLHCYSELAIFEHSIGNAELALKLLQHTVALSNAMYGQNHPEKARAAFFAASMMKGFDPQNQLAAVPFFRSAQALAQKAYGSNSIMSANASYQLGQCYIVDGRLAESVPYIEEALRIFELRHGKEGEHTRDASQLLSVVKTAIEQEAKGELEKVEKLAKRIGADPARAKELISRMQSTSAGSSLRRGGRSTAQKAADEAVEASSNTVKAAKDTTGSRGHLDVDDLVLYIEGEQKKASTSSKGGKSKKGGSKK